MQQPKAGWRLCAWVALVGTLVLGCSDSTAGGGTEPDLVRRGRAIYTTNCIACHAPDPTRAGALGPEVAGSSHELLERRVMSAAYPDGYPPKRQSTMMQPMPHLEHEIEALHAFLNR